MRMFAVDRFHDSEAHLGPTAGSRITSTLALVLGLVGLLLASVGIYGHPARPSATPIATSRIDCAQTRRIRSGAADQGDRHPHDAGRAAKRRGPRYLFFFTADFGSLKRLHFGCDPQA